MSVYRINDTFFEQGQRQLRTRLRIRYAVWITVLCAALAAAVWHTMGTEEEFHFSTYVIGISALVAIIIISLRDNWRRGIHHLRDTVETFCLTVEPEKITCQQGRARPIELEREDIVKVKEYGQHGIHLCMHDPKVCIVIPAQLENLEECKQELRSQGLSWKESA
jgi:hypothetical protein